MLKNKTVAVCVSGGIAAYKACDIVSQLKKLGANVFVVMTTSAKEFVSPLTFETLSNNKVISNLFDNEREWEVGHISLAKRCDLFLIAPATANIIGKLANGIADDFLSTTLMATTCPVLIAPAMNTAMLNSPAYKNNQQTLINQGFYFVEPTSGRLACGDSGKGRLAPTDQIIDACKSILLPKQDYLNKRVLVTLGSTREYIDPIRFIGNESSGKMGASIIKALVSRGAMVTAICANVTINTSELDCQLILVTSASEMLQGVKQQMQTNSYDLMIFVAAVADYKCEYCAQKIKSPNLTLNLTKNQDIAQFAGKNKANAKTVIFSAETQNLYANAIKKLNDKNADMVVANNVTIEGAGFNCDTNIATLIKNDWQLQVEKTTKDQLAHIILDNIF